MILHQMTDAMTSGCCWAVADLTKPASPRQIFDVVVSLILTQRCSCSLGSSVLVRLEAFGLYSSHHVTPPTPLPSTATITTTTIHLPATSTSFQTSHPLSDPTLRTKQQQPQDVIVTSPVPPQTIIYRGKKTPNHRHHILCAANELHPQITPFRSPNEWMNEWMDYA